jgi:hypothetical protein
MGNNSSTSHPSGTGVTNIAPRRSTIVRNKIDYHLHVHTETQFDEEKFDKEIIDFHGMVTIEAPRYESENRAAVDIIAVLDKSGSMAGQKISLVRKSMRRLVRNLGPKDRVAFIQFDTTVDVLMEFTRMDDKGRTHAKKLIADLHQGSSTNICDALTDAIAMLQNNVSNSAVKAILLFTDGQANAGPATDMKGILSHVRRATGKKEDAAAWSVEQVCAWLRRNNLDTYVQTFRQNGVDGQMLLNDVTEENLVSDLGVKSLHKNKMVRLIDELRPEQVEGEGQTTKKENDFVLHTFGFGANHNSTLLESIASEFEGMYFFMENEQAIIGGFANVLGGLLSVAAKDIELTLKPENGCGKLDVLKDEDKTVNKDGSVTVRFNDLQSEESRHIIFSITLPKLKGASEAFSMVSGVMKYKNVVRDQDEQESFICNVKRTGKRGKLDVQVDVERNRILSARALKDAEQKGDTSDLPGARLVVKDAINSIMKSPSANECWCKDAISDLQNCLDGLQNQNTYVRKGKNYMVQNAQCYTQERNCNYTVAEYTSQAHWDTNTKVPFSCFFEFRTFCII